LLNPVNKGKTLAAIRAASSNPAPATSSITGPPISLTNRHTTTSEGVFNESDAENLDTTPSQQPDENELVSRMFRRTTWHMDSSAPVSLV
jgi:hypothetical protein